MVSLSRTFSTERRMPCDLQVDARSIAEREFPPSSTNPELRSVNAHDMSNVLQISCKTRLCNASVLLNDDLVWRLVVETATEDIAARIPTRYTYSGREVYEQRERLETSKRIWVNSRRRVSVTIASILRICPKTQKRIPVPKRTRSRDPLEATQLHPATKRDRKSISLL